MKLAIHSILAAITITTTAIIAGSPLVHAATNPSYIGNFNQKPSQVLKTKSTSWRDPAFGDTGWTHNSGWGKVWAKAGQIVTIKTVASQVNLHPGISVWYRGVEDTAPDNYVTDHFYVPNANQFQLGATDENTGATIGNIVMKLVKVGFDKDLNSLVFLNNGIKDGVSGKLALRFTATKTGTYLFVVGGFSPPHAAVNAALMYDVQTNVTITTPAL